MDVTECVGIVAVCHWEVGTKNHAAVDQPAILTNGPCPSRRPASNNVNEVSANGDNRMGGAHVTLASVADDDIPDDLPP